MERYWLVVCALCIHRTRRCKKKKKKTHRCEIDASPRVCFRITMLNPIIRSRRLANTITARIIPYDRSRVMVVEPTRAYRLFAARSPLPRGNLQPLIYRLCLFRDKNALSYMRFGPSLLGIFGIVFKRLNFCGVRFHFITFFDLSMKKIFRFLIKYRLGMRTTFCRCFQPQRHS